jgi:nitrite reductase (NADH) large subunit
MNKFLIIGNSAAAIAAVEAIRARDTQAEITMISDEDYPAYCRCLISYFLAGDVKKDKVMYRPESFYKENNINLVLNKKVSRVLPKKNRITCEDKTQFNYDVLLIATGAHPKIPEIKGIKKNGVFGFRTLQDVKDIQGLLPVAKCACVLGGGLVGIKAAYALKKRNLEVKVVVSSKQIMSQVFDYDSALLIQKRLEENGIEFITQQDAAEIIGEGDIKAVKLTSGKIFACSLVVVGKGVEPNIEIAQESEIKIDTGILADASMRTNIENIYTAGDVCESYDLTSGKPALNALWTVAVEQGKTAGENMAGGKIAYDGSLGMNATEFFGLPVVSLGMHKLPADAAGFEELKSFDPRSGVYRRVLLKDNLLKGAILTGNINAGGIFLRLMREKIDVSSIKEVLLDEGFGYPAIKDLVKEKEIMYV